MTHPAGPRESRPHLASPGALGHTDGAYNNESPDLNDPATPHYSSRALFGRLWRDYLSAHAIWLAIAVVFMVIEGGSLGVLSYMLQPMFDLVFIGGRVDAMWWVGGVIFSLFFFRAISAIVQSVIMTRVALKSSIAMQVDLLRHLMRLDSVFFQTMPPGSLMERVQGDTTAIQTVWRSVIKGVGRDSIALISLLAVALSIDPVWTMVALIGAPVLVLPAAILQRYVRRKTAEMRETASQRSTRLNEIFHGIDEVKLNRLEAYQLSRFQRLVDRIVGAEIRMAAGQSMLPALIDIMTGLGFLGVLILGGREIIAGEKTVGEFMSFFTAMSLAFQPLRKLGGLTGIWQVAAASLERLFTLFDTKPGIISPVRPVAPPDTQSIVLSDVTLAYGDHPVLRGTSFTAEAGKTTALVGASGAGKSTVFNVLTRLVETQGGKVTLGGVDIRQLDTGDLRGLFSVVTQDALLFDETIRENILLGQTDVSDTRLAAVLKAAHVDDFVSRLPEGLDTPAGPRGSNLSGGQRQRVAIARALLRDAPILLLDEATSALDAQSEKLVQDALERLSKGRTTLVIAHRLATIRSADKIVVMNKGQVVDHGTHAELIAKGGLYADLYHLQFEQEKTTEV